MLLATGDQLISEDHTWLSKSFCCLLGCFWCQGLKPGKHLLGKFCHPALSTAPMLYLQIASLGCDGIMKASDLERCLYNMLLDTLLGHHFSFA